MQKLLKFYKSLPNKMITFDLTGICNLSCSMCVWHNGKKAGAPKRHLDFTLFQKTIDSLLQASIGFHTINLSVSGEPTLHPQFVEVIRYLFKNNTDERLFKILSINTNMVSLAPEKIEALLSCLAENDGILYLVCSLNSASKQSDFLIKNRHSYEIMYNNTHYLIRRKSELKLKTRLKLDLQLLILRENFLEVELFVNIWTEAFRFYGLNYSVVGNIFSSTDNAINLKREFDFERQAECDERYDSVVKALGLEHKPVPSLKKEPTAEAMRRSPCPALWQTPIIRSDGQVSVCLSDIDSHMEIGNLNELSFLEIWLGSRANQFRQLHMEGDAAKISICSHCTYYEAFSMESAHWKEYSSIMQVVDGVLFR